MISCNSKRAHRRGRRCLRFKLVSLFQEFQLRTRQHEAQSQYQRHVLGCAERIALGGSSGGDSAYAEASTSQLRVWNVQTAQ
eukprot:4706150-Pleurochrysis_carterae.AAC.1